MSENQEKPDQQPAADPQDSSPGPARSGNPLKSLLILSLALAALGWFVAQDPERAKNIALMLLGFGMVIFVHELGHFFAAKAVGIEVEAFSIGINPILIGIRRVQGGFRIRLLPGLIPGNNGQGALSFFLPMASVREGETEYRLCLIPLGGFVKMLGQEDMGADKPSDNPRAFGNKTVWQRVIVISAGVFMNVVCAAIVFMFVFARGLDLAPAVVGGVLPDSPAQRAGIRGGDEIIAIDGKDEHLSFMNVTIAAAFADEGQKIPITVRHPDGSVETFHVEPEMPKDPQQNRLGVRMLGISPASTLTIPATIANEQFVQELKQVGFDPGDTIVAIQDRPITRGDELEDALYPEAGVVCPETISCTLARTINGKVEHQQVEIPMELAPRLSLGEGQRERILGMTPRLRVVQVTEGGSAQKAGILPDDIILRFGTLNNPTHAEMQEYCEAYEGKPLEIVVQRPQASEPLRFEVTAKRPSLSLWQKLTRVKVKPLIGVALLKDLAHPVVADCGGWGSNQPLPVPRGALIRTAAGQDVANWRDLLEILLARRGQDVAIAYEAPDGASGSLTVSVPQEMDWVGFVYRPDLGQIAALPLAPLERTFKGKHWLDNLEMGADMTYSFIAQTYLFIRGMIKGTISIKAASGPVGILKMSYSVAKERSIAYYCFFVAMISVAIAVFNFLPLPILDGGLIVMLVVEKIKGSPLSLRTQSIIATVSWVLILGLFAWITYHDIVKVVTGQI
ncbi:MAG: site-2 protease family protein [Sedimentisphaerales bacterium]|nr:site-2 protease family protein [Sedimentisphaerales bacterium]